MVAFRIMLLLLLLLLLLTIIITTALTRRDQAVAELARAKLLLKVEATAPALKCAALQL